MESGGNLGRKRKKGKEGFGQEEKRRKGKNEEKGERKKKKLAKKKPRESLEGIRGENSTRDEGQKKRKKFLQKPFWDQGDFRLFRVIIFSIK